MGGGGVLGRTDYDEGQRRALNKRTALSAMLIFVAIPATIAVGTLVFDGAKYMLISLFVLLYTMLPFFLIFERRKPKAREIVLLAMMSAITVCAHMFFHVTVPLQIGTAMVVIAGISMGPEAGFLVGALSRFICNFYLGQGPWTPWQMFSWGLLGFLAGLTFNKVEPETLHKPERQKSRSFQFIMGPALCVVFAEVAAYISFVLWPGTDGTFGGWRVYAFGAAGLLAGVLLQRKRLPVDNMTMTVFTFAMTVIVYGGLMNLCAMFTSAGVPGGQDISFNTLRLLYVSGLPYDLSHGAAAALCIFLMGNPMIRKIERIKIKYGIYR